MREGWARERRRRTHATVARKAKAVETRDGNVRALLLDPRVRAHLAGRLLVDGPGVATLGQLVRHGAAQHEPVAPCRRVRRDGDAEVEAAEEPALMLGDGDFVSIRQAQVMSNQAPDRRLLPPEHVEQLDRRLPGRRVADAVYIRVESTLVRHRVTAGEREPRLRFLGRRGSLGRLVHGGRRGNLGRLVHGERRSACAMATSSSDRARAGGRIGDGLFAM